MRKFYSAIMALSVLLFASCDKNEGDIGTTGDGVQAKMGLTISFPVTNTKYADDLNATENEAKATSITVFIFENDGSHAEGSPALYNTAQIGTDFDYVPTSSANEYVLKPGKEIETTAGAKRIYAGINLPSHLNGVTEDILIAAASTDNLVSSIMATSSTSSTVAMLSKAKNTTLIAYEDDDAKINEADLVVERLMSKIAVTASVQDGKDDGSGLYTNTGRAGGEFKLVPDAFTVGNIPTTIYPVQRIVSNKLVTPGLAIGTNGIPIPTAPLLPPGGKLDDNINAKGTATTALNAFYVPEHAPSNSRYDATYAVVRAEFTFKELASVENEIIVVSNDGRGYTYSGKKVWVVQNGLYTYFCASLDDAEEVEELLIGAKIFEYHAYAGKFYTFYYVFINNDVYGGGFSNNDRLALYRNQFYNILINDVQGMGVPGDNDGSDPDEEPGGEGPLDPDEPYNPPVTPPVDNPDDPDPVYEELAKLKVTIEVQEWEYRAPNVILEPLK